LLHTIPASEFVIINETENEKDTAPEPERPISFEQEG
jgi:hypothetical protein